MLDQAGARYVAPAGLENARIVATSKRLGDRLQTTVGIAQGDGPADAANGRAEHHENSAPLNALPQAAVPWLAAGMPQEANATLALYLLSMRDYLPRPGYVLTTKGRQSAPADPAEPAIAPSTATAPSAATPPAVAQPWRIDLMYCGIVVESYWFSDQRRLICIQTQGVQSLISRRVESAKTAATPMDRIPATRTKITIP